MWGWDILGSRRLSCNRVTWWGWGAGYRGHPGFETSLDDHQIMFGLREFETLVVQQCVRGIMGDVTRVIIWEGLRYT